MGFLFLIMIGLLLLAVLAPKPTQPSDKITVFKKRCPPHEWFWQEIVDQHGVKQGERICCKNCGPLSKSTEGSVE